MYLVDYFGFFKNLWIDMIIDISPTCCFNTVSQCSKCEKRGIIVNNWLDRYPEGSTWYRDVVCINCGYNHGSGYHESESRLSYYKNKLELKTVINYEI